MKNGKLTKNMIFIPEGRTMLGTSPEEIAVLSRRYGFHRTWLDNELPSREVNLKAYWIDKYEATNEEYLKFVMETNRPWALRPENDSFEERTGRLPATCMNWDDAHAYAQWQGKRLPTGEEWEKAARGPDGQVFPWGNVFKPDCCNWNGKDLPIDTIRLTPVDAYPSGRSPYGVHDMCGNVSEWCGNIYGSNKAVREVRGGGWHITQPFRLRPAYRGGSQFYSGSHEFLGFRCALSVDT